MAENNDRKLLTVRKAYSDGSGGTYNYIGTPTQLAEVFRKTIGGTYYPEHIHIAVYPAPEEEK